jgi:hypothetical protein
MILDDAKVKAFSVPFRLAGKNILLQEIDNI